MNATKVDRTSAYVPVDWHDCSKRINSTAKKRANIFDSAKYVEMYKPATRFDTNQKSVRSKR